MIGRSQVVVDGLGYADDAEGLAGIARAHGDCVCGAHRAVAARVEQKPDRAAAADREQPLEVGFGHRTPRRAKRGGRRPCHGLERAQLDNGQIDEVLVEHPFDSEERALDRRGQPVLARLLDDAKQARVDDGGRTTAVHDQRHRRGRRAVTSRKPARAQPAPLLTNERRPQCAYVVATPSEARPARHGTLEAIAACDELQLERTVANGGRSSERSGDATVNGARRLERRKRSRAERRADVRSRSHVEHQRFRPRTVRQCPTPPPTQVRPGRSGRRHAGGGLIRCPGCGRWLWTDLQNRPENLTGELVDRSTDLVGDDGNHNPLGGHHPDRRARARHCAAMPDDPAGPEPDVVHRPSERVLARRPRLLHLGDRRRREHGTAVRHRGAGME